MNLKEFDKHLRGFEPDYKIPEENYIIVRLDGRAFHNETKGFEKPFDQEFHDWMTCGMKGLMLDYGVAPLLGYTQSDEVSLLFDKDDNTFARKARKWISLLASAMSATYTSIKCYNGYFGGKAIFDGRVCIFPNMELVKDYFSWRVQDAERNAINSYAYWTLRKEMSAGKAHRALHGVGTEEKVKLLADKGIDFNTVPEWHKRGSIAYPVLEDKKGFNPITKESVITQRRVIGYIDCPKDIKRWMEIYIEEGKVWN